jgi:hypothetical protein
MPGSLIFLFPGKTPPVLMFVDIKGIPMVLFR